MPVYNPKTVLLMASLLTGLMGITLLLLDRTSAKPVPGARYWAAGSLMSVASGALILLRGEASAWLTFTLQNTLVMLGYTAFLVGSVKYFGATFNRRAWGALFALAWLAQTYFTHGTDSVRGRFLAVTGYVFVISLAHAAVFVREVRQHRTPLTLSVGFTAFWAAVMGVVFGLRWSHAVLFPEDGNGMLDASWLQQLYIYSYAFGLIMMNIGFELMVSERIRARFEWLAMTDTLTGVRSRRALVEAGADLLERSRRNQRPFTLMLLDLDHFKSLNDQYGHQIGDQVLRTFCQRVSHVLRRSDVLGRIGGEEFAVLLPDTRAARPDSWPTACSRPPATAMTATYRPQRSASASPNGARPTTTWTR